MQLAFYVIIPHMTVRTRIAPSPTGIDMHIGNLYTALINYVWAKKNHGQFIVRIEDTDRTRFVEGAEANILKTLEQFGLKSDENPLVGGPYGPYRQSDRLPIYQEHAQKLVEAGHAYYSFATKEQLDKWRSLGKDELKRHLRDGKHAAFTLKDANERIQNGEGYTIRLLVPPESSVTFTDVVRGEITIPLREVDDQVLLKSDGFPTYHLAVVVDDYHMRITHIIRAEEWINSTPKHVLLYKAFGWELPVFVHVPILRNPDKTKLSKRKNAVWARWYVEEGFLPEAILNYLALMGWSHPQEKEIFSMEEFIRVFELTDLKPVGPVFDIQKLTWMNGEYIRVADTKKLTRIIVAFYQDKALNVKLVEKTVPLINERIKTLKEYWSYAQFFYEAPQTWEKDLTPYHQALEATANKLASLSEWHAAALGECMQNTCQALGLKPKDYFMAIRVAITGKTVTPPLNESMEILGQKECVERLKAASQI